MPLYLCCQSHCRCCFLKSHWRMRKRSSSYVSCVYFCLFSFAAFSSFCLSFSFSSPDDPISLKVSVSVWLTVILKIQLLDHHLLRLQQIPVMDHLRSSFSPVHFVSVQTHCFSSPLLAPRGALMALTHHWTLSSR